MQRLSFFHAHRFEPKGPKRDTQKGERDPIRKGVVVSAIIMVLALAFAVSGMTVV